MDSSYGSFLATCVPITEVDSASNHSSVSNTDVDFGNKIGSDEVDASYKSFLATYDMVIEIDNVSSDYGCSNPIWSKLKPQTDPETQKSHKTEYYWMCLDAVL